MEVLGRETGVATDGVRDGLERLAEAPGSYLINLEANAYEHPQSSCLPSDFIRNIVAEDEQPFPASTIGRVVTRFPPEPNGYLHIGHAKSICLNFDIAQEYPGGICHLRFDDTNPSREDIEFVESIKADVEWLGFDWGGQVYYASDYFEQLYEFALQLIRDGKAYVCDLSPQEIREYRGTLTEPGTESPFRDRTVGENLDLLGRMRAGEFDGGARVLRAKIDMASPNLNLRDPVLYRILKATHHRTGDDWCIFPTYDFAHGQADSIEGVTHSICTLEFEDHRPLYDWLLETLQVYHPQQIEFARLNLTHTVLSKRRLQELVEQGHVSGWDDPRMPTLSGLRRRGLHAGRRQRLLRGHRGGQTGQRGGSGPVGAQHPRRPEPAGASGHGGVAALEGDN